MKEKLIDGKECFEHLSNDKEGVYPGFNSHIAVVLKNNLLGSSKAKIITNFNLK